MSEFDQLKAFQKLKKLANNPIDLVKALTPERVQKYIKKACGFKFLFGTERVDDATLEALIELANEAKVLEKMAAMQSGEILNKIDGFESENRRVLHTAMRDLFDHPQTKAPAHDASKIAKKELDKLSSFLKSIEGKFTDLIQIGIGGSDLGPRALCIALEAYHRPNVKIHFISNVDPDDATQVLKTVNLKKTLVVVVSKSGTTLETLTNEEFVREQMIKQGIDPKNHFVAVTGEKSPMDDPSKYLASFYIWDFIGGRYSATSMVGAVMLSFAIGIERFFELLKGAHEMDLHALHAKPSENLPLLSALLGIWNRNFLNYPTVAIIPYSQALLRFTAHLQQLDMESNGKSIDKTGKKVKFHTGPVIWGEPGTNGQHSFYQLIHQGTDVVPVEFIGFKSCQMGNDLTVEKTTSQQKLLANLLAQSIALAKGQSDLNPNKNFTGNRSNRILFAEKLDPKTLGALLAFYEHKVAFQGFIWNINSFDQEGVQLGKKLANKILSISTENEAFPLGKAFLDSIVN